MASSGDWNEQNFFFPIVNQKINVKTFGDLKLQQIFCQENMLWLF